MSEGVTQSLGGGGTEPTRSTAPVEGAPRPAAAPQVPTRIGRYAIKRVLGEGGMGTVYEAEQDQPRRAVALKVIRAGYLSPRLLKRFEHEAEILGRLQHPGIAQVYEAGTVNDERGHPVPFFAMEFIKGPALTEYAASRRLGTRERLDLVARICEAVYHAHQKGVIHRDLKPGNILVDESGQPKILDFGVARATDSDVQQTTLQTDIGQLIGTVPYMSPEQVGGDPGQLDTRSDVYALGVIAYELLAGRLPYSLDRRMIHDAVRVIREEEPTRLSSINRTLRGDVETIVAKALEKDKLRRYQSAESLASDIRRYLKDEPIAARPASTWYQAAKFSRRNKGLVAGATAAFVFLSAGLVLALISRADAVNARNAEKERADELKQVSEFQAGMLLQFNASDAGDKLFTDIRARFDDALTRDRVPETDRAARSEALARELAHVNATDTATDMIDRTILKPALETIDKQFKDKPVVNARLRSPISQVYTTLGRYDDALREAERAYATRRASLGEEHPDTLTSLDSMGVRLRDMGKLDEAEPYFREALEKRRRVLGEEHEETIISIHNMGSLLQGQGHYDEAERYYREGLEKNRRVMGEEHLHTLVSIDSLASVLQDQGRLDEAEPYYRDALKTSRRVLGDDHSDTIVSFMNMGFLLKAQKKLAEAEPYLREALERGRRVRGEDHPDTIIYLINVASLLKEQGKLDEAEPLYREALEKFRRVLGEEHPHTLVGIYNMGLVLDAQGKPDAAEPYYREALEKRRRVLGEEDRATLTTMNNLGVVLRDQGKLAEAVQYLRDVLEKRTRVLGDGHLDTLISTATLGSLLRGQGKLQEAADLLAPAEAAARKAFTGGAEGRLAGFLSTLGLARAALPFDAARFALAEADLVEAHPIHVKTRGEKHKLSVGCAQGLIDLYTAWDKADPGKGYDAKAAEWKAKLDALAPTPEPTTPAQSGSPSGG